MFNDKTTPLSTVFFMVLRVAATFMAEDRFPNLVIKISGAGERKASTGKEMHTVSTEQNKPPTREHKLV